MQRLSGNLLAPFISDCYGPLAWIYLLQAAIEFDAGERPQPGVVYRGIVDGDAELAGLYCSAIGEVVVWPAFASASRERPRVLRDCATHPEAILFEITLGHGAIAAEVANSEVLIAADSAFRIVDLYEEEIGDSRVKVVKMEWVDDWLNAVTEENVQRMLAE
jgi:hypothetical protein